MNSVFDLHRHVRDSKNRGRKLLAIYLTCGFPKREWTVPLAREIFLAGADFLELGMPFSDPLADGPTIQRASQLALDSGINSNDYFEIAALLSEMGPTVFMGYLNSVTSTPNFLERSQKANLCGLILPEWPVKSAMYQELEREARDRNLPRVPFIAPTTRNDRVAMIDALDAPFIYAVLITGVTGARNDLDESVVEYLTQLKYQLSTPFLAGFGVSTPDVARQLSEVADGVIVGSALLDGILRASSLKEACQFTKEFVSSLRAAIDLPAHA